MNSLIRFPFRWIFLVFVLLAAIGLVLTWLRPSSVEPASKRPQESARLEAKLETKKSLPIVASDASQLGRQLSYPAQKLREAYESADNMGAFIQSALNAEVGGAFYAYKAYDHCAFLAKHEEALNEVASGQTAKPGVREVVAKEKQRCAGVLAQFGDSVAFGTMLNSRRLPDPLDSLSGRRADNRPLQKQIADLQVAVEIKDANVLLAAGQSLLRANNAVVFNGEALSDNARVSLHRAWDVVACQLGADCSKWRFLACMKSVEDCEKPLNQFFGETYGAQSWKDIEAMSSVLLEHLERRSLQSMFQ